MSSSGSGSPSDRLFVPLNSEPWEWFRSGDKSVEVRRVGPRFNLETCRRGRAVELRKGYSGASLWGRVGRRWVCSSASEVFREVEVSRVVPSVSEASAVELVEELLGSSGPFIAFEVTGLRDSVCF